MTKTAMNGFTKIDSGMGEAFSRIDGHESQAGVIDQGQQFISTTDSFPSTEEQTDMLYNLFSQSFFSCSLAQKGNYLSAALDTNTCYPWIIDSGATDHMTGSSKKISSYSPCAGNQKVKIADGSLSAIAGKGSIILSPSLTLHDVLQVPKLSCNLLSISKLTQEQKCQAKFFSSHCEFQDLDSGKTIGSARQRGGLYFFEDGSGSSRQSQSTCFESISVSGNNEIMLWHLRLGHPNFW